MTERMATMTLLRVRVRMMYDTTSLWEMLLCLSMRKRKAPSRRSKVMKGTKSMIRVIDKSK